MSPKIIDVPAFKFVGIEVRTCNRDEMTAKGRIGPLWERFYSEGIQQKIPHQVEPGTVLAVYTDYEDAANGDYTLMIGAKVSNVSSLASGLVARSIPATKSAVFTSERGPIPEIIINTWKTIWGLQPDQVGANRAFIADVEVYDARSHNPKAAQVEVHLSVKDGW